jgi:hypothetical protein
MVNGRSITGRLSVGLSEIRRPTGSGRLETQLEPNLIGFDRFGVGLILEMTRSIADI